MILDQTTVVRLMVIETIEDLGIETATLMVTLTEEITPLIIKGILIRIGIWSDRTNLVCTYPRCGLRRHKEEDCWRKADDLHSMAFKDSMVTDVKAVVESAVIDRLKALGFSPGPGTGS